MRILFCLSFLCITLFNTRAQSPPGNRLTGKIRSTSGQAVPGVALILKRSGRQTVSDAAGGFAIPLTAPDSLLIRHVGYQPQSVSVRPDRLSYLTIVLEETVASLQDVVVNTGYQTLPKERATGSFAYVDNQLLNRRVSTDVVSKLEGVVPGLLFNRNTVNAANGLADISIRGHSTLFANDQPLIVVDGFPYDGDLSNLNPNDVESISVLKDAAAASIWGVRSGNGVIVITTKKGRMGQKLSVEFNANVTVGNKPDLWYNPNFLDASDFINVEDSLFVRGYYNASISDPTQIISPVVQILANQKAGRLTADAAKAQIDALRTIDVRRDLSRYFYRHSTNQQYAINLRGGGTNSDYFFSLGEDHNQASLVGNTNNRLTLNAIYNFYPVKNLEFSAGFNFTQSAATNNSPVAGIQTSGKGSIYPYAQLADAGGQALAIVKDYSSYYTDSLSKKGFLNWQYRPLDELRYADNTVKTLDNRINLRLKYSFFKGLNLEIKYQYEKASSITENDYSDSTYYARNLINKYTQIAANGNLSYPVPVGGILQQANNYLTSHHLRSQLGFTHTWKTRQSVSIITGAEINEAVHASNASTAYGYDHLTGNSYASMDYATYFNLNTGSSAQVPNSLGFGKTTDHYLSYYGNAAYGFHQTHTVSLSGRIDHSNLFGVNTNQKAVPLYSLGYSWNLSKESFYHLATIPYAQLRMTYGFNGNIDKSATAVTTLRQYSLSNYWGIPYDQVANPGNPELRWEKQRMINFGLDFGLKNQVITGSIEYYLKKGIDLFGSSPLAPSTGLTSFYGNTANTTGHGWDLVLNSRNIKSPQFEWTTQLLLSHATDHVSKYAITLSSGSYMAASASSIFPLTGKPLFAIYSYPWGGLDPATGDPLGYIGKTLSNNYNTILTNTTVDSMVYNGPARPTLFGSLRNTFSYKGFSLSLNILLKLNYYFRRASFVSGGLPWGTHKDFNHRWQQPGDERSTTIPSLQYPPVNTARDQFYTNSSILVDKGDHIRLQDISLSYTVSHLRGHLPFSQLQLYAYLNNIGILWRANHDHLDPDLSTNTAGIAPLPRSVAFGLKANF